MSDFFLGDYELNSYPQVGICINICILQFLLNFRYSGSTFYSSPITAYSSPFAGDISSHNLEHYSSIHDSTVHSDAPSYSFDHGPHDLDHEHHEFEHHSSDFGHYIPDTHDISSGGGEMMSGESKNSASGSVPSMSATYRRVGKHRRRRANKQQIE